MTICESIKAPEGFREAPLTRPLATLSRWERVNSRSYRRFAASSASSDLSPFIIVTCPEIISSLNFSTK